MNLVRSANPLTLLTATEMAEMVRVRKISPRELVAAHLEQIEKLNPRLNAFAAVDAGRALERARAAEDAVMKGGELGALHGVPITIKSSIDVAGLVTSSGSRLRSGQLATADAPLVARLKAAGAIVLGNTSAPEMLMAYETDNLLQGHASNPWALDRTPGGSSGCGGSIRVPAHFTGICGLKPTPGRVPGTGHYPPPVGPFALIGVVGPMARVVADLLLMLEAMAGPDPGDSMSAPVPWRPVAELRSLRVSWFEDDGRTPVTPETRAAVRAAAEALREAGLETGAAQPPGLERARELWWVFFGLAGGFVLRPALAGHEDELSPIMKKFLGLAASEPPLTA